MASSKSIAEAREKILQALAECDPLNITLSPLILCLMAGYKRTDGKAYRMAFKALKDKEIICASSKHVELTDDGRQLAPQAEPPKDDSAIQSRLFDLVLSPKGLPLPPRAKMTAIFEQLLDGGSHTLESLSKTAGYTAKRAMDTKAFRNLISRMKNFGMLEQGQAKGTWQFSNLVFPVKGRPKQQGKKSPSRAPRPAKAAAVLLGSIPKAKASPQASLPPTLADFLSDAKQKATPTTYAWLDDSMSAISTKPSLCEASPNGIGSNKAKASSEASMSPMLADSPSDSDGKHEATSTMHASMPPLCGTSLGSFMSTTPIFASLSSLRGTSSSDDSTIISTFSVGVPHLVGVGDGSFHNKRTSESPQVGPPPKKRARGESSTQGPCATREQAFAVALPVVSEPDKTPYPTNRKSNASPEKAKLEGVETVEGLFNAGKGATGGYQSRDSSNGNHSIKAHVASSLLRKVKQAKKIKKKVSLNTFWTNKSRV